jgi:prepilin-type N-terminal cleavage/methylation domain-containing protein
MLEFELYWFRLYLTRNANPRSEPDGSFFIGDCEEAAELRIERWSPYSVASQSTRGFSLLEVLVVLAVLLILGAISAPTLLDALHTVKELMALVSRVVVH